MTRKQRAFKTLAKNMRQGYEASLKARQKECDRVGDFLNKYGPMDEYTVMYNDDLNRIVEGYIFAGAWFKDRFLDKSGIPDCNGYKKSLTKKIRKALGYNS